MSVATRIGRLDAATATSSALEAPGLAGQRNVDPRTDTEVQLGLSWLLKLRWGAVAGQLIALIVVRVLLGLDLPYVPLLGLVSFTAASNALLTLADRPATSTWRLPGVLTVDVAVLTAMLAASGGASNPFTVFFLVHVALAALLLEARLAWAVVALTVASFGALFLLPSQHLVFHEHGPWSTHLVGMWIAYVLAAGFVATSWAGSRAPFDSVTGASRRSRAWQRRTSGLRRYRASLRTRRMSWGHRWPRSASRQRSSRSAFVVLHPRAHWRPTPISCAGRWRGAAKFWPTSRRAPESRWVKCRSARRHRGSWRSSGG